MNTRHGTPEGRSDSIRMSSHFWPICASESCLLAALILPTVLAAQPGSQFEPPELLIPEPPYHFNVAGDVGIGGYLDMGAGGTHQWIIRLRDPSDDQDAATKHYVDKEITLGNAATATALAANGFNCSAGQYARGVDAQGNAEGCTTDKTNDTVSSNELDAVCSTNGKILKRLGGVWNCADDAVGSGDNLGNHIATENLQLRGYWLSGDGGSEGVYVATDGSVGIGESAPVSDLHVNGTDGVLFQGVLNAGIIPAEGPGTRFMWYPRKAALRTGYVNNDSWDDDNIGFYSTGLGFNATAKGFASTALGDHTTASGLDSIAMGFGTVASGQDSTAIGTNATASGFASTAMGQGTIASGKVSTAMGHYTYARSYGETVVGLFNTEYQPASATELAASDRVFVVGNGTGYLASDRSDAVVVLKNGNVGIGDSTPPAKLTIENNLSGSEITDFSDYQILLYESPGKPGVSYGLAIQNYTMAFNSDRDYKFMRDGTTVDVIFANGRVGISDATPTYRLDVNGDINTTTSYRADGACVFGDCTSDRRLKQDIEGLQGSLGKIARLQPSRFRFVDEKYGKGIQYGLVAQDVEEVVPEIVTEGEGGYKRVRYGLELQMNMLQAIKELMAENDALKTQLLALRELVCRDHPGNTVCL